MRTSSLLKLLSKLDKTEWKSLDKFVHSPYFNANKLVLQFWEFLKKYSADLDSPKLDKEKVFQKLFGEKPYKDKKMWQLMSDLKGLVEQFLVAEKTKKNSISYQMQLKEAFLEKELYDWFEQKSNHLNAQLNDSTDLTHQYYLHQIHNDWYFNSHSNKTEVTHPNLLAAHHHLQQFYYIQELKYACEWAGRSLSIQEELPLFVHAITYRSQYAENLLYKLYYDTLLLFSQKGMDNAAYFQNQYEQLKKHIDQLPQKDQIVLLLYLVNYGIKKFQTGQPAYFQIVFQLYKLGLQKNCLIYQGNLQTIQFMNIVGIAARTHEFDWLDEFIPKYLPLLNESSRILYQNWANAIILFSKANYQEAIYAFDQFHFEIESRELPRRSLQIRACLECFLTDPSYFALLKRKSLNFEKYLTRTRVISAEKKSIFGNLNKLIRTFAQLIYDSASPQKIEHFYNKVQKEKNLPNKEWLLDHISQQKNRWSKPKSQPSPQSCDF